MTIRYSKDQERFVHEAVRAGLYTSEDAVVRDALDRLRQTIPTPVLNTTQGGQTYQGRAGEKKAHHSGNTSADAGKRFDDPATRQGRRF